MGAGESISTRGPVCTVSACQLRANAIAAVSIATGLAAPGDPAESLEFLRTVNSLGMLAYIVCALVTLLFIALAVDPFVGEPLMRFGA